MLKSIQKSLLTYFLSTGFCYAASRVEPYSHIFYAPVPQTMAIYIATYDDKETLELIANQLLDDVKKSPLDKKVAYITLDLQRTKEIISTACTKKANEVPQKFCLIELFTHQHRIRSTYMRGKQLNECDPFDPYEWSRILVYPDRKNDLALFLDCKRLRHGATATPKITDVPTVTDIPEVTATKDIR